MGAKKSLLFLYAVVILQIINATEPESSNELINKRDVFKCPETGVFPNLEDCLTYHVCIPYFIPTAPPAIFDDIFVRAFDDILITCDNGFGYDPKTSRCTLSLYNGYCPEIIPKCQTAYQLGPVVRNPSLYYICIPSDTGTLVPELYVCPIDMIHDGISCVIDTPPSGLDSNGLCIKAGAFYHPADCTKHRDCSGPGVTPVESKCSACYKFNWRTEECEMFNCDNHNM